MPDASGKFKGISVPSIPWRDDYEKGHGMADPTPSSYEWVTVLVIRHKAGSQEGAIHQRNAYDQLIVENGGETMMAWTESERDAMTVGYRVFERLGADSPEQD